MSYGAVISLLCGVCTTTTTTTIMTCYDSSIESVHTYTRGREGERERDGGRERGRERGREGEGERAGGRERGREGGWACDKIV